MTSQTDDSQPVAASRERYHTLRGKRAELLRNQAEATARTQRRQDEDAFRRAQGAALEDAGIVYQLLWPDDGSAKGPLGTYPIGFASVHWPLVPDVMSDFAQGAERVPVVARALTELGVAPATAIVVDSCLGGTPRIMLTAQDFLTCAEVLLGHEAWLYELDGSWLIEVYHEGTVSYARRPGSAELAGDAWRKPVGEPR